MKYFFSVTLSVLIAWSVVAWLIQPTGRIEGKTPLVWISDDNPARKEQVRLFNDLHEQYHLSLDPTNTGMEKVIVQCLGGVGPDLFDCYDGFQLSAYVKSGIAWDVTDELAEAGIHPPREVWSAAHPIIVYEGRVYGYPTNAGADAIWINEAIFEEAGVAIPTGRAPGAAGEGKAQERTWDWQRDFVPLAQRMTRRRTSGGVDHFGFLFNWWQWRHFIRQWGGRVFTEDKTRCIVDCDQSVRAVQFMQDLVYKYRVSPTPAEEQMASEGGWGAGTIRWFAGGKAAMALGGRWWLCQLRRQTHPDVPAGADEATRRRIDAGRLRLTAVLSPRATHQVYRGYGRATLINKASPRREQALAFLKYMAGPHYNNLMNHQADALCPAKRFCLWPEGVPLVIWPAMPPARWTPPVVLWPDCLPSFLVDPEFPEEAEYNAVWVEAMAYAVPDEVSPFVNGNVASRIITEQLDLVKSGDKTARAAMRTAADQVNREIAKMLDRDPSLRKQYDAVVRGGRP